MKNHQGLGKDDIEKLAAGKVHFFAGALAQRKRAPRGFGIRVTAAGTRSFVLRYSFAGRDRLFVIGQYPTWQVVPAIEEAIKLRRQIDRGEDPLAEREQRREEQAGPKHTVESVCEEFFRREGPKLRTAAERQQVFKRLVYPVLGPRDIYSVKRSELVSLFDDIADENGEVMSDRTLAYLSRVFNWFVLRSDDFRSPIARGMARTSQDERARDRVLKDDELRAVWRATEACESPFGALVRFILLTGARRAEAANMPWSEIHDGLWTLSPERNKVMESLPRPLIPQVLALLPPKRTQWVFSSDGVRPISGFTKFKAELQQASGTADWTIHDLRRTWRTLASRAGVAPDIAERCLGHVIGGVRGVYDRYEYIKEKREAYEAVAGLIERIIYPQPNVVPLVRPAS